MVPVPAPSRVPGTQKGLSCQVLAHRCPFTSCPFTQSEKYPHTCGSNNLKDWTVSQVQGLCVSRHVVREDVLKLGVGSVALGHFLSG